MDRFDYQSLDGYQAAANQLAVYPGQNSLNGLIYTVLGLNGEAGEVAEKVKKIIRDDNGNVSRESYHALIKELGDVLWYLSQCCKELDIKLSQVAFANIAKLSQRKIDGTLQGSGDDR